ncbi:MAG TPA: efflux RND transporter permease subunit [Phycisphaerales bacterium]|nr:efflux RND transporter permease subunit [Phycisphaerales bacterium]
MNFLRLMIRQPVTVVVGMIIVVVSGLLAVQRIPVQLTPTVEDTIVSVRTFWEGASPQEIEQEIIDEQEEKLQGLSNLKEMNSFSSQNEGSIRLEFALGTKKEDALREVSNKLREVPEYPETADEPIVEASDPQDRDYIAWIVMGTSDPDFDVRTLQDFAEDRVKTVIERVAGVSEVNVLGGREREVQVRIDPVRLAQRRITAAQIVSAIRSTNQNVSAGRLADGRLDVRVRTIGQYETVRDVERTVVAHVDGVPVLVRDVADVAETHKEASSFVRSKGRPVLAINVQREVGTNVIEVMAGVKRAIAGLNAQGSTLDAKAAELRLDGELFLTQVYDETIYIDQAIALVQGNIWVGGALAVGVLLLFLRSLAAVGIIAVAIPLSIIGAFVVMVAMGRSINVVSLAGMAFAVGMVVDNAIVVLENTFRHVEMGKSPMRAAYDGVREVWGAVLASTLTTVVVFVPILLIQEEAGQLFRDIALAICAAVMLSLAVSITVVPCAAARVLRPRRPESPGERRALLRRVADAWGGGIDWLDRPFRGIPRAIGGFVHWACGSWTVRIAVVGVMTVGSLVGSWLLLPPSDYLPTGNRNLVFGMIVPPPGYNIEQQTELGGRVEATMRPFWEAGELDPEDPASEETLASLPAVPTFDWATMQPGPPVVPPPLENYFFVGFGEMMFHGAIATDDRKVVDLQPLFQHATRPDVLPGVMAFGFQMPLFRQGGLTGSAVKIDVKGDELDEVTAAAQALYMRLGDEYGFGATRSDPGNFNIPGPELRITPDRVRLADVGMTPTELGLAVQAAGDGAIIGDYRIGGETIDLKVISADAVDQSSLAGIRDLPIATPSGHVVPLSALAEVQRVTSPVQINRVNRQRAVTLEFTAPRGLPLETAISAIDKLVEEERGAGRVPPGVNIGYTGSASKLQAVREAMLGDGSLVSTVTSAMFLALLVCYLLMCVLFQSWLRPLVIMFAVPPATLGGFLGLALVHWWSTEDPYMPVQNLDVITMLGIVLLIGTVVNNAILLVHQALNFMRGRGESEDDIIEAMSARDAIAESVRTRIRPIMMTSLTSVLGMLPLVIMPGSGSELYRGMGAVVAGGMLVSTVFTLILVPLLFSLVHDMQLAVQGRFRRRASEPATAGFAAAAMVRDPGE